MNETRAGSSKGSNRYVRIVALAMLAVLLALVLPSTVHGDLRIAVFNSSLVLTDHPNFYHALADEPTAVFPTGLSGGPYGPLYYYPMVGWLWFADLLGTIDVRSWEGPNDPSLMSPGTLIVLKVPNLVVYGLVAIVLARLGKGERRADRAILWLANPAVILFTLMMGQNDAWTVLALAVATLLALRELNRDPDAPPWLVSPGTVAMVALAVGGAIKLSPLLMTIPFALVLGRTTADRLRLAAVGFAAFLLLIAPFLSNEYFRDHSLFGRQAGQVPEVPLGITPVLYLLVLAVSTVVWRRTGSTPRALFFALLAVHLLLFALPGWNPQRAVLFLGVLLIAAPRRWEVVVAYVGLTLFALLLALEHQNEIAAGLFQPLTDKVLTIPPLLSSGRITPLYALLYAISGVAWLFALIGVFSVSRTVRPIAIYSVAVILLVALEVFILGSAMRLNQGVQSTPYRETSEPVQLLAGQELNLAFFPALDELRAVRLTFGPETPPSTQAELSLTASGSTLIARGTVLLQPGENRFDLARVENSAADGFQLSLISTRPVTVQMVRVPEGFVVASATLDGVNLDGVPHYTLDHRTTWSSLLTSAGDAVGDAPWAFTASALFSLATIVAVSAAFMRASPLARPHPSSG